MDYLPSDTSSMDDQTTCSNMDIANLSDEEMALNNEEEIAFPDPASATDTYAASCILLAALDKELNDLKMEEVQLDDILQERLDNLKSAKENLYTLEAECKDRARDFEMLNTGVSQEQEKVNSLKENADKIQAQIAKEKEQQVVDLGMFEDEMEKIAKKFISGPKLHSEGILLDQMSENKEMISKSEQMIALYNREVRTTELQFSAVVKGHNELKSGLTCLVNHIDGLASESKKKVNLLEDQRKELTNRLHNLTMHVKMLQSQNL